MSMDKASQTVQPAESSTAIMLPHDGRDVLTEAVEETETWRGRAEHWRHNAIECVRRLHEFGKLPTKLEATTNVALRVTGLSREALDDLVEKEMRVLEKEEL